jgi:peptidylprolyl isomerase
MAAKNKPQQRVQAKRMAARAAAAQRASRRKRVVAAVVVAALVGTLGIGALLASRSSDDTSVATNTSTTTGNTSTTIAAMASAAGKPCVPVSDPLPAGAPAVDVKVGPPPTTLVSEDLAAGSGATVQATDTLTVNYIGVSCSTGKVFDSSYSRNQPANFPLNQVIPGWQQGIPGMKVGGRRLLGIPPDLAYGKQGQPPTIAPDETLWFVVEVVDAKPA